MKLSEIFRISLTNLKSNRMRTLLTVVGISIGIATIVFLVSLGYGLQELSIKKIASIEAINTLDVSPGKNSSQLVDDQFIEKLKKMQDIGKISPLLSMGTKFEFEGKQTDAVGNFIDDDYAKLEGINPVLGAFFANSPGDAVVSTALLKAINVEENNALMKEANVNVIMVNSSTREKISVKKQYKIIGVIKDDSTSYAFFPKASVVKDISWPLVYNSVKVKVGDQSKIQDVKSQISSMGYSVTSIADTISQVDRIFNIIQLVLAFFGFVALMVASIGMFNTMTIALLERTRDIGIMKSIGVKDRDVSKIFLFESALIATSGGLLGVIGGWLTAKIINFVINILAQSVGGEAQNLFSMPIVFALIIVLFSMAVGIGTGFYPSKRASKLNPLDALRYE
ncbi:MAG: Macrolide export ATP-binding/permease protein MacB [bacterium ADurb.Bin212]|nr:MAG: Macrolide export ATP-binding/permease protein MacB [bacterium ADurb.Bin212]